MLGMSELSEKVLSFQERLFLGAGNLENLRYMMIYVLYSMIYIYIHVCVCVCHVKMTLTSNSSLRCSLAISCSISLIKTKFYFRLQLD